MGSPRAVAVLQIIPNHHFLLPEKMIRALAALETAGFPYVFYDITQCPEQDFRSAIIKLFSSIKEGTVLVSMACHNNYPKIESLLLLYTYLPFLQNKTVIVCSPYFSLYETSLIQRDNVTFSPLDLDEHVARHLGVPLLDDDLFFEQLDEFLTLYGYRDYRFWSYLTFGCYARCSFCYNRLPFKGAPAVTRMNPETVLKWMRAGQRLGKTYFEFSEPNFLADRPFALEFLERLRKDNPGVTWRCKARLDDMNPDIYTAMTAAGCRTIFFGVEHVDQALLKVIRKGENSVKKLAEFLAYRRSETALHLSFLTGIRGETPADLRRNLDFITKMDGVPNVEPNLGWNTLFDRKNREAVFPNFAVAFMYMTNMLPHRWSISQAFMKDVVRLCRKEPFFDFLCVTESEVSLKLMQTLVVFMKTQPRQQFFREYDRFLTYENGLLPRLILKSRALEQLNEGLLSAMGV